MVERGNHDSVLLEESLAALALAKNGNYVDATFGRGGHSAALLAKLGDAGQLLVIDKDPEAIAQAQRLFGDDPRVSVLHGSFAEMQRFVESSGLLGKIDGVLMDLGVSSPQLDTPERGFSFSYDGPLDMRMDTTRGESAADWVNGAQESEIAQVLKDYGEERFARRMARAIVTARTEQPISTTGRLADIVAKAHPAWEKGKHPATRAFQAIRIKVNRELDDLTSALQQAVEVLASGGRLVVISFHSLEDRKVKQFIRAEEKGPAIPRHIPIRDEQRSVRLKSVGKALRPSKEEVSRNVRARSAVLRVAERI